LAHLKYRCSMDEQSSDDDVTIANQRKERNIECVVRKIVWSVLMPKFYDDKTALLLDVLSLSSPVPCLRRFSP